MARPNGIMGVRADLPVRPPLPLEFVESYPYPGDLPHEDGTAVYWLTGRPLEPSERIFRHTTPTAFLVRRNGQVTMEKLTGAQLRRLLSPA